MGISVLGASDPGTFLVLPQTLLLRGYEHVHEYQIINENKIGWYLKVKKWGEILLWLKSGWGWNMGWRVRGWGKGEMGVRVK